MTFEVDPATAQIVKAGQSSGLSVSYKGQPIRTDVTAAQLVLWNAGKLPIMHNDVLRPVVFATSGEAPILEASLRANSRDVTGATLDTSQIAKGRLGVNWGILEHDDGVRVQIIFAGDLQTRLSVDGVIMGQKEVLNGGSSETRWPPFIGGVTYIVLFVILTFSTFALLFILLGQLPFFQRTEISGRAGAAAFFIFVLPIMVGSLFATNRIMLLVGALAPELLDVQEDDEWKETRRNRPDESPITLLRTCAKAFAERHELPPRSLAFVKGQVRRVQAVS